MKTNPIKFILDNLDKINDVLKVVKAFFAGLETFTNELKGGLNND